MASLHKKGLTCALYKNIAKSSDCLMSNMCWMSDELMGEGNIMAILFHSATSQKLAGSICNRFIGIFHLHNPSGRTMALRVSGVSVPIYSKHVYIHMSFYTWIN
jgi:hypothetical protein